jgi:hypothetical protein
MRIKNSAVLKSRAQVRMKDERCLAARRKPKNVSQVFPADVLRQLIGG